VNRVRWRCTDQRLLLRFVARSFPGKTRDEVKSAEDVPVSTANFAMNFAEPLGPGREFATGTCMKPPNLATSGRAWFRTIRAASTENPSRSGEINPGSQGAYFLGFSKFLGLANANEAAVV